MSNSIAYQGRGSSLKLGDDSSPVIFSSVAQLQKFSFGGAKTATDKITNLDSPTAYDEVIATTIDPGDVSFDGVLNPQDTTYSTLNDLQAARTLSVWKITLTDGTTYVFDGYVTEFVPADVSFDKAITFSGKITITGAVTITPAA